MNCKLFKINPICEDCDTLSERPVEYRECWIPFYRRCIMVNMAPRDYEKEAMKKYLMGLADAYPDHIYYLKVTVDNYFKDYSKFMNAVSLLR